MPTRILIADDNEVFRKALRKFLEGADHWEIIEACNGQEAVSKALETQPNVVILDLAMPVKDGLTAARDISQAIPGIPVVMCTMHLSPHLEAEALKSGIRKVVSKSESSLLVPILRELLISAPQDSAAVLDSMPPPLVSPPLAALPSTAPVVPAEDAPPISSPPPKNVA